MASTKIEWADCVWNPCVGCCKVSPACDKCWAERMAGRLANMGQRKYQDVVTPGEPWPKWRGQWNGDVFLDEAALTQPLHWRKPSTIFVVSMGDLFYEKVPFEYIDRIFAVMALCPQHTFLLLTKRPERAREYLTEVTQSDGAYAEERIQDIGVSQYIKNIILKCDHFYRWPLPNVWLGCTAENQEQADKRIPILLDTPAAKRFVSVEPMLGPVDLKLATTCDRNCGEYQDAECPGTSGPCVMQRTLDWVICGGESGPGARPMHPDWARSLRDQCVAAGVALFVKQLHINGKLSKELAEWPKDLQIREFPGEQ